MTFLSPSWRSLSPLKGHLTIPKRSQRITRSKVFGQVIQEGDLFIPKRWVGHVKPAIDFGSRWVGLNKALLKETNG